MARFYGKVGYAETVETAPGVLREQITEYPYSGNIVRNSRTLLDGEKVNNDLSVNNTISIVADAYARKHFFAIKYVQWSGALWVVAEVTVRGPRLLLRLGGVYNGQTPDTDQTP